METTQYTIYVPGRGYLDTWSGHVHPDARHYDTEFEDAEKSLKAGIDKYLAIGCPEIAMTLQIVTRTATLTYSDWSPL